MKIDKSLVVVLVLFLAISLALSWQSLLSGGNFVYRDATTIVDMQAFRASFFDIFKNFNLLSLDFYKRIPESWIYLLLDMETFDRIKFTFIPFITLLLTFIAGEKILEDEKVEKTKRRIISSAFAIVYLINPLTLQIFLKYYPMLNFAVFPLFFYFLYKGFTKYSIRHAFYAALLCAFMFLMVVHSLLYSAIAVLVVGLLSLRDFNLRGTLKCGLVFAATCFFALSFVIFPYFYTVGSGGDVQGFHAPSYSLLSQFSYDAMLPMPMLMDYQAFWWPWVDYPYPGGKLFFIAGAVLVSALLAFAIRDRSPWSIAALLGLAVTFFFSKGASLPFAEVYAFLHFNTPLVGWLMRVPNKFLHLIPFFISLAFLRLLSDGFRENSLGKKAFAVIFMGALAFMSWPFFTGDAGGNLEKTDYTLIKADLAQINGVLNGTASVLPNRLFRTGYKNLYGNTFSTRTFLIREANHYAEFGNWSGLDAFSRLGIEYVVTSNDYSDDISRSYEPQYEGEFLSLFPIANETRTIILPSNVLTTYSSYESLRSLMRSPPDNISLDVVLLPMSIPNYPEESILASDVLVMDSVPVEFMSVDSARLYPFAASAKDVSNKKGWTMKSLALYDRSSSSPFRVWDNDFGKNMATTSAAAKKAGDMKLTSVLGTDEIEFKALDDISSVDGTLVTVNPGREIYTSVRATLPIESGQEYTLSFNITGNNLSRVNAELYMLDARSNIVEKAQLRQQDNQLRAGIGVPPETVRVYVLVTALASEEQKIRYSLSDFELSRITYNRSGKTISRNFNVREDGEYDVYLRLFRSPHGGLLRFYLDGEELYSLKTSDETAHFYWEKAYSGNLSKGAHSFTVEQLGGFNALNVLYYAEKDSYQMPDLSDKTIIYRLIGMGDFGNEKYQIAKDPRASTFQYAVSEKPLLSALDIISNGTYAIDSSARGSYELYVDGRKAGESLYLEKGPHTIEVRPLNGTIMLDYVTLIRRGTATLARPQLLSFEQLGQSDYSFTVNSTGPFFVSFNRGFNPGWQASANGNKYSPFHNYFSSTGYYINETGTVDVTIGFEPQGLSHAGAALGALGLMGMGLVVWRYGK